MKLSIIIVSWNVRKHVLDCLRSAGQHALAGPCEIIVVDNGSADGTAEAVRRGFPAVNVVANRENRGFAVACNQGMAQAQGEYLLLLNPDTRVHSHALDTLCAFMDDHPDVGACAPKLLNDDGTVQASVSRFPSFRGALHRHTLFRHLLLFRRRKDRLSTKLFPYDTQRDVDQPMGAALLLRRSALDQVGWMDERFFMYYEEVDLCYRLKQAGWRVVFVPDAVITHSEGQSSSQIPVAARIMVLRSLLRYFRKHRGLITTGLFNCLFKPAVIAGEMYDIVVGALTYAVSLLVGNDARRRKSAAKVRHSAILLGKYSWWLLLKA